MKNTFRVSIPIILFLLIFFIHSCKKDKPTPPIITTIVASAITQTTAISGGNITSDGGATVTSRGVIWDLKANPTIPGSITPDGIGTFTFTRDGTGTGTFTSSITGLTAGTVYYVKSYAFNNAGLGYGNQITFTTATTIPGAPTIGIATAGNAQATVRFFAPVINDGSVITGYTVTSNPGNIIANGIASPITVTGLTNGTAYTFTVTATFSNGTSVASSASNPVTPIASVATISDIDGNSYKIVTIGTQVWMAENLKTTKYNDGTAIPNVTDNTAWATLKTGAYSDYNNTPSNSTTYGRLYNWYAVDNNAATKVASNGGKNVCPTNWHVPTDGEWTVLTDYLTNNGYGYQGSGSDIAKSMASTSGWLASATAGTVGNDQASNNSSGFTALPGGYRRSSGSCTDIGYGGYWWSSTGSYGSWWEVGYSILGAWGRYMYYSYPTVYSYNTTYTNYWLLGFSVRCVRD